ncbi:NADPH-dependent FMN reductase [Benzoatithermus flavus]|uniref:NAD(P)H-dependent oxidoreductase n=1 Tax=Benzoatithermus flavus TaxID=3108223 RepID=A0ABU8XKS9_9PROT
MERKIQLALIYGSTREGRFCDKVARWAIAEIERHGAFALDVIDPAAPEFGRHALAPRIGRADGFVVVTPEYNHSYPAPLKALIDSIKKEWQAKPVAFVSYGGISGGLRAVEHLRLVFAELHAIGIRDSVSFAHARDRFDAEGGLHDPEAARQAMATMLARLAWWATALRHARAANPYEVAA